MRRAPEAALLAAIALLLGAGIVRLLDLRYAAGDVYPPYSSLRSDPVGARVLHDALLLMPGLEVARRLTPLADLDRGADTTVLILGVDHGSLAFRSAPAARVLPSLAARGARVVLTLAPVARTAADEASSPDPGRAAGGTEDAEGPETGPDDAPDDPAHAGLRPLAEAWGVRVRFDPLPADDAGRAVADEARRAAAEGDLPPTLPWHSAAGFETIDPAWTVLYQRGGQPVLIERPFGRGSIVLAADSYFASNEAMLHARPAALLARLLGGRPRVVFDETHHGVIEAQGVARLFRRYGLHGALLVAAALFGLFLWGRLLPFVPPYEETGAGEGEVTGRDAAAGLLALVQRGVAPRDLARVCVVEYGRAPGAAAPLPPDAAALAAGRDPVAAYRAIARALAGRRRRTTVTGGTIRHGQ
jgi:hypothetical protein